LGFGIKPHFKGNGKHDSRCVENKITSFDHADIYGSYTTEADLEKVLPQNSERESAINI
jgi:predicted oxidoreductase